jgi:hypothetical protein
MKAERRDLFSFQMAKRMIPALDMHAEVEPLEEIGIAQRPQILAYALKHIPATDSFLYA